MRGRRRDEERGRGKGCIAVASFPGHSQILSASDGKLGGAWERG